MAASTKPSLSQYPSVQDDTKDKIDWPVLPDSLVVQVRNIVLLFKVKSREMTRPLFRVLSITSPWINGKRSISLSHTCGPLFPSIPPNTQGFTLVVDVTQMSHLPVSSKPQYFCFSILGLLTGPVRSIKIRSNTFEWARTTKLFLEPPNLNRKSMLCFQVKRPNLFLEK